VGTGSCGAGVSGPRVYDWRTKSRRVCSVCALGILRMMRLIQAKDDWRTRRVFAAIVASVPIKAASMSVFLTSLGRFHFAQYWVNAFAVTRSNDYINIILFW
jgi:hypothetical protein